MTYQNSLFSSYAGHSANITMGDAKTAFVVGSGSVLLLLSDDGCAWSVELTNVLHVPACKWELISVLVLAFLGVSPSFTQPTCVILADGSSLQLGAC